MNVKFYTTPDGRNVLNKSLANETTKSGTLKEDCDILKPVILFNFNPVGFNYAYIADFGRYYYIDSIVNEGAALWRVKLSVDVLMSWKSQILNSPCICAKSSNDYNLNLNDPNYKCYQNDLILMQRFPLGFDTQTPCFVMTVLGDKVADT